MFLAVTLLGGFTACGDDDPEPEPDNPIVNPTDTTKTEPEDPDTIVTPVSSTAGWPAEYGGVMLQAFYWDGYTDAQWTALEQQADQLAGTFDLVWLPQSGKGANTPSMGYDPLYWFPGHYDSSFGTEQELRSLINTFKQKGIKTIADVVINHRGNYSSWTDFPTETYNGETYSMTYLDIVSNDEAASNGYQVGTNPDTGEGWSGMRDLDHKSENVQRCVKAYLNMLLNDLGYAGFRYDMVKGYSATFTGLYNASSGPEFSVGECWDGTETIKNWIENTSVNNVIQSAAFDFQFKYVCRNAFNDGVYNKLNQRNDGNWPLVSSNQDGGKYRRYAVTFVENHDTEVRPDGTSNGPLTKDTLAANAYLLAMPGTPCVFMKHWQAYPVEIKAMVAARKQAGINNESSYRNTQLQSKVYGVNVDSKLQVVIGETGLYVPDAKEWVKVLEGYHYAYYFPTSMETAYADLPSGNYEGAQRVRLSAVTAAEGAQLVYTLDGTTPTAGSPAVASGTLVDIPVEATTTLTVGLLVGSQVSGIVSRTYTVKMSEKDRPVEIPSFCTVSAGEVCAFFEAPSEWTSTVACWAWDANNGNVNYTGGEWPGAVCALLGNAANGHKVWKWTFSEADYKGAKGTAKQPTHIIFNNNGSPQTRPDFEFTNGGYYNQYGLKGTVSE